MMAGRLEEVILHLSMYPLYGIAANCPETSGTVPDFDGLSLVPHGSMFRPGFHRLAKISQLAYSLLLIWVIGRHKNK